MGRVSWSSHGHGRVTPNTLRVSHGLTLPHFSPKAYPPHVPSLHACSPELHVGCTKTVLCTLAEALLSLVAVNMTVKVPGLVVSMPQY